MLGERIISSQQLDRRVSIRIVMITELDKLTSPHQNMQEKMQLIQDPNQSNVDILNNEKHEFSKHFGTKRRHI